MEEVYTIFVRDLASRTICLTVTGSDRLQNLRESIEEAIGFPCEEQYITGRQCLDEAACLQEQGITADSTLRLSGRLRGGKGGFGSLLRGSGKTAMTENEDACRDLSGRRLRLVNADKKLQDWAAAEKQRKEEKQAVKEERDRLKAEVRAEETQTDLEAIRKDQNVVLSSVAKALESSRKSTKRSGPEKISKAAVKKTRYLSDSEEDSEDEDNEEEAEALTGEAAKRGSALPLTEAAAVAIGSRDSSTAAPVPIKLTS